MTFKPLAGMLKQLHTRSEHFAASGHAAAAPPEQRDELASPHSITSSAVASNVGGTVRPSVLGGLAG